jgi:hypothetical protein
MKYDLEAGFMIFESEGYEIHRVKLDDFVRKDNFFPYMASFGENDEVEIL